MKGHVGIVLTAGLAAGALALALLQILVVSHGAHRYGEATASRAAATNRYSAPGGRAAVPWLPFDKDKPAEKPLAPARPEGSKPPPQQQQEQHAPPPPSRFRMSPPRMGPQRPRSAAA